ncbi:hypothetical protein [Actinocrispum sp. NPDC049592]|uniref:hypothetical protein n=1 Tax=Actinocrispum sp. NPDC049592 TaxID=3154835 RepID=UPI00341C8972
MQRRVVRGIGTADLENGALRADNPSDREDHPDYAEEFEDDACLVLIDVAPTYELPLLEEIKIQHAYGVKDWTPLLGLHKVHTPVDDSAPNKLIGAESTSADAEGHSVGRYF